MGQMSVSVDNQASPMVVLNLVPVVGDCLFGSRTSTGTVLTVPAGRFWHGSVSLSANITIAGNASCSVSVASTGGSNGTIHALQCQGLALTALSSANTLSDVWLSGGTSGATVTFTSGAAGSSSGQASGVLL